MAGNDGNPYCPLVVDGSFGYLTCCALQWKIGTPVDGSYGQASSKALEAHLGLAQDADIYPDTGYVDDTLQLQNHLAAVGFPVTVDGRWGSQTTAGVQAALNSTRF